MKTVLSAIGGVVIVVGIIALGYTWRFADAKIAAKYNNSVGIEVVDSQRNKYEHSATYVEAKAQELSKERLELAKTTDPIARKAIISLLVSDCANLDINDLNDASIRQFLSQIRDGGIQ